MQFHVKSNGEDSRVPKHHSYDQQTCKMCSQAQEDETHFLLIHPAWKKQKKWGTQKGDYLKFTLCLVLYNSFLSSPPFVSPTSHHLLHILIHNYSQAIPLLLQQTSSLFSFHPSPPLPPPIYNKSLITLSPTSPLTANHILTQQTTHQKKRKKERNS